MYRIDFHTHTHHSYDCRMDPVRILTLARERGLNAIVINDHDTIKGGLEARDRNPYPDLEVIVGAEIKTDIGDVTGIYLKEEIQARAYPEVLAEIERQGGLSILNHPFVHHRLAGVDLRGFDLIEGYNGRTDKHRNAQAIELARSAGKPIISGSDAHTYREVAACHTVFDGPGMDRMRRPVDQHYRYAGYGSILQSILTKAVKTGNARLFVGTVARSPIAWLKHVRRS
ncbi:MAG: PHP domain-containing protein [Bacteroidetes bacterium]|nr:PHP domain-containing protein [Bacteroidota bacterium]